MELKCANPKTSFQAISPTALSLLAPCYLLSVHLDSGPQAESCKIRMKHPHWITFSLRAIELQILGARWDTQKFNSTENSIWDQTFPGASSAAAMMCKRHTVAFQPEQSGLQSTPPPSPPLQPSSENHSEANLKVPSLWELPHWRVSLECSRF